MDRHKLSYILISMGIVLWGSGCMYWQPAFQPFPAEDNVPGIESSLVKVTACSCRAQGGDALTRCIFQFEDDVMKKSPDHYPSLITLAHLYLLYGDGYVNDPSQTRASALKSHCSTVRKPCAPILYLSRPFQMGDLRWRRVIC